MQPESCCASNSVHFGNRIWDRSHPCPEHQDTHSPLQDMITAVTCTEDLPGHPSTNHEGVLPECTLGKYVADNIVTGMQRRCTFQCQRSIPGPLELYGGLTMAEEEKNVSVDTLFGELASAEGNHNSPYQIIGDNVFSWSLENGTDTHYGLPCDGSHHTMGQISQRTLAVEESAGGRCLQRSLPEVGKEEDRSGEMALGRTFTDDTRQFTCSSHGQFMHLDSDFHILVFPWGK